MRTGNRFTSALLLLASCSFLVAAAASADTVYLKNGRSFDGVVADDSNSANSANAADGGQLRVQIEGGTLTLPRSSVLRVEKADSSLAEYLRRKAGLRRSAADARAWLDLARWADSAGLASGAREAALAAAALNPRLEGLDRELRAQNYLYDDQLGRWLPYADEMRRKGMVLDENGDWITRQEQAERVRERNEERLQQQMVLAQREAAHAEMLSALGGAQAQPGPPSGLPYDPYGTDAGYPYGADLGYGYGYGGFVALGSPGFRLGSRHGVPFRSSTFSAAPGFHRQPPGSLIQAHGSLRPFSPAPHGHARGARR